MLICAMTIIAASSTAGVVSHFLSGGCAARDSPRSDNNLSHFRFAGHHTMKRLLAIIFSCALAQSSHAHTVTLIMEGTSDHPALILIRGKFLHDEHKENITEFLAIAARQGKAVVFFDSDGGALATGLSLGKLINQRGFDTAVEDYTRCLSSCAVAWLGGKERFMGLNARVGFHAASISKDNHAFDAKATDVVKNYMKKLGFDQAAISYMTDAPPSSMASFSIRDAERLKIQVRQFSMKQPEWAWAN